MAKEIAIGKRAKISKAQQYMMLAVLGASLVLGAAISLTSHFIQQISFNTEVIKVQEESIAAYSDIIQSTGTCTKPSGSIYSDDELDKCDPNSIEVSQVPDTLRYNIIEKLAANKALNSVPRESNTDCIDPATGKSFTYKQLSEQYKKANGASELQKVSQKFKTCSALRVIPDALPAFKNEEALLASVNKIFIESDWEPETISPSDGEASETTRSLPLGVNPISVILSIEANSGTTMNVLNNIERSIREFDINKATIEWGSDDTLVFRAEATAYYVDESTIAETNKVITTEGTQTVDESTTTETDEEIMEEEE